MNTETNENINKRTGEIYKTRPCTRKAINSYIKGLKNNNPELYERRLQYSKDYYLKNKMKLKEMMEKLKEYETKNN